MDTFPDLGALQDQELKDLIDILRAELVNRLRRRREEGEAVITGADVQQLTDILSGKGMPPDQAPPEA
jgi:hypothetical protein